MGLKHYHFIEFHFVLGHWDQDVVDDCDIDRVVFAQDVHSLQFLLGFNLFVFGFNDTVDAGDEITQRFNKGDDLISDKGFENIDSQKHNKRSDPGWKLVFSNELEFIVGKRRGVGFVDDKLIGVEGLEIFLDGCWLIAATGKEGWVEVCIIVFDFFDEVSRYRAVDLKAQFCLCVPESEVIVSVKKEE